MAQTDQLDQRIHGQRSTDYDDDETRRRDSSSIQDSSPILEPHFPKTTASDTGVDVDSVTYMQNVEPSPTLAYNRGYAKHYTSSAVGILTNQSSKNPLQCHQWLPHGRAEDIDVKFGK